MTAVVEKRPWLPRYHVVIFDARGRLFAKRRFWSLRGARTWAQNYAYEQYANA
jgi:hypothetical protein